MEIESSKPVCTPEPYQLELDGVNTIEPDSGVKVDKDGDIYIFPCPHCHLYTTVGIGEVNCHIFRHGSFKKDYVQLNPHSPKPVCDMAAENDLLFGCGKPFMFKMTPQGYYVFKCGYI